MARRKTKIPEPSPKPIPQSITGAFLQFVWERSILQRTLILSAVGLGALCMSIFSSLPNEQKAQAWASLSSFIFREGRASASENRPKVPEKEAAASAVDDKGAKALVDHVTTDGDPTGPTTHEDSGDGGGPSDWVGEWIGTAVSEDRRSIFGDGGHVRVVTKQFGTELQVKASLSTVVQEVEFDCRAIPSGERLSFVASQTGEPVDIVSTIDPTMPFGIVRMVSLQRKSESAEHVTMQVIVDEWNGNSTSLTIVAELRRKPQ